MDNNIHMHIRCINRSFTYSQWVDFLKNEWPCDDIIYTSPQGYKFNPFDVCKNPDVALDIRTSPWYYLKITTAPSPCGRFSFGTNYSVGTLGGGCGCTFIDDPAQGYATREEAVRAAISRVRQSAARKLDENPGNGQLKKFLNLLGSTEKNLGRPSVTQLTLFPET